MSAPSSPSTLSNLKPQPKRIVVGVTGSIAAYKSALLVRELLKAGHEVKPVMTERAKHFLGEATLRGLTGQSVSIDMWKSSYPGEEHVELSHWGDVFCIAPCTADMLSRLAQGRADGLIPALALCWDKPLLVAPAMHPRMWHNPATQANIGRLQAMGRVSLVGPEFGEVASGDEGLGRMSEPSTIAWAIERALTLPVMEGRRIVVSAGPTAEDVDPVRYLTNRSSGKMGYAIAEMAALAGAQVSLVSGPTSLAAPPGVRMHKVRSAVEMQSALRELAWTKQGPADALIMAAAVGDFRPKEFYPEKQKRQGKTEKTLELVQNPDIIAGLSDQRGEASKPYLVAFAVETAAGDELIELAQGKLERKGVEMVVANRAQSAFGGDENEVVLVDKRRGTWLPKASKREIARQIIAKVANKLPIKPKPKG